MAMQKNRNLFQLTLTWMFIFICLQCLFVKSLPTDTSTILPVKNTMNSTVQSTTVKDTSKVVGSQIITPNNTTTIKLIVPTNTTVSPGSQAPTITITNDNKSSASPKIAASPKITASPKIAVSPANKNHDEFTTKKNSDLTTSNSATSKQSLGLGNQNETPATLKPDETENHNGLNKSTTTKKPDGSQDQSGLNKSTTTKKPDGSQDQSGLNKSTTTKKPDGSQDQSGLNKSTTTTKPDGSQDQSGLNKSTTTKKSDGSQDQSGLNKSTTTKKPDGSQDQSGLNKSTTTKKTEGSQDQSGLNKSTTTKKIDGSQDQSGLNKSTTESADKNVQNNIPGSKISVDTGETSDRKKDENKKPMNSGTLYEDDEDTGGHFMAYFITFVVICIAGYIIYHNKQKILAFILEGKKDGSRRRPNSKEYKRLKTDEVMPSLEKNTSDNKYIY